MNKTVYGIIGEYSYFTNFLLTVYDTTGALVYQSNQVKQWQWLGIDTATGKISTKYKLYVKISYTTAGNITDSSGTFVYLLSSPKGQYCLNVVNADTSSYEFIDQFDPLTGFVSWAPSDEIYCN